MKRFIAFLSVILLIIPLVSCKGEPQGTLDSLPPITQNSEAVPEDTTEESKESAETSSVAQTSADTTESETGTSDTAQTAESTADTAEETEKPSHFMLTSANAAEFSLIRPIKGSADMISISKSLEASFKEKGFNLDLKTDYVSSGNKIPENEPSILIGETNRSLSVKYYESLKVNDYVIAVEGNQLVIVGGSDAATQAAVEFFTEKYLSGNKASLIFPAGVIKSQTGSYKISDLTLCGKSISEYEIVIPRPANAACNYAASLISQRVAATSGHVIKVVSENVATGKAQIYLNYKNSSLNDTEYAFKQTANGFEISATKRTLIRAVRELTDVLTTAKERETLDVTPKLSETFTMELPSYSLPSSLNGKVPIGLCDQKNNKAVVIDLSAKAPTADSAIIWEWTPSSSNGFTNGFKNRIDDLKL
ncbi:MAG: hypothetical protein E7612_11225, partial [Ruminococcaceae bacterium]|nr:hypothetical protein [Oscillospiraceae bacterium]